MDKRFDIISDIVGDRRGKAPIRFVVFTCLFAIVVTLVTPTLRKNPQMGGKIVGMTEDIVASCKNFTETIEKATEAMKGH
jgi:hypothetical protein